MAKSKWFDKKWLVVLVYTNIQMYRYTCSGADPGFLLGGGALVSCSTSTPINHIVFFLAEYQLDLKTAGHLRGGGCAPPALSP